MKLAAPLLRMPYLHQEINVLELSAVVQSLCGLPALSLWVGLPLPQEGAQEALWQPDNYPFSPQEAAACVRDIANMGDIALSGVPVEALVAAQPASAVARDMKEQEELQDFVAKATFDDAQSRGTGLDVHILRAAQRFLLMAWYVEERFLEVRSLTNDYAQGRQHLTESLGAAQDEEDGALEYLAQINAMLYDVDVPLPDWKKVLENVAVFLPQECSILVHESAMAQHIRQHCSLKTLPAKNVSVSGVAGTSLCQNATFSLCSCTIGDILHAGKVHDMPLAPSSHSWHTKTVHCILVENF